VVLIGSRLTNMVCIMKKDIRDNPLFGGSARLSDYICNDSIGNMVRAAVSELKQGSRLLIFPESTRTLTQPVNQFTRAFALIARRTGVPVQTVFIADTGRAIRSGQRHTIICRKSGKLFPRTACWQARVRRKLEREYLVFSFTPRAYSVL
jgi:1-acyl-sn-glycerol-3-phosphate acyltransferase